MKIRPLIMLTGLAVVAAIIAGPWLRANPQQPTSKNGVGHRTLLIKWQRLVGDKGQTCERCGSTQDEVRKAGALLRKALAPLGIEVKLEEKALNRSVAVKNIAASNQIFVGDRPIETWLGASSGTTNCSSCAVITGASSSCRTVVIGSDSYESIPSPLIVKAGLLAAAEIIGAEAPRPKAKDLPLSGVQTITDCAGGSSGCCPQ